MAMGCPILSLDKNHKYTAPPFMKPWSPLSENTKWVFLSARAVTGRQCPNNGVGEDFLTRPPIFRKQNLGSEQESREKTAKFGPKMHYWSFWAKYWHFCWLVGWWLWHAVCISQDTYLLYEYPYEYYWISLAPAEQTSLHLVPLPPNKSLSVSSMWLSSN